MEVADDRHFRIDEEVVTSFDATHCRRRRYAPPELVVYGSLIELTRLGQVGAPDGLSGSRPAG